MDAMHGPGRDDSASFHSVDVQISEHPWLSSWLLGCCKGRRLCAGHAEVECGGD